MSINIPTQEQIDAEIKALEAMKPSVRETNMFGDSHHEAIEAQITVLKGKMRDNQIYDRFEPREGDEDDDDSGADGRSQYVLESALTARNWLSGDSSDGSLSEEWESLVTK